MKRIDEMMELKAARLRVDLADLREFDSELAERFVERRYEDWYVLQQLIHRLVREPFSTLAPFEAAAKEVCHSNSKSRAVTHG